MCDDMTKKVLFLCVCSNLFYLNLYRVRAHDLCAMFFFKTSVSVRENMLLLTDVLTHPFAQWEPCIDILHFLVGANTQ